jgi:hypothetical protein
VSDLLHAGNMPAAAKNPKVAVHDLQSGVDHATKLVVVNRVRLHKLAHVGLAFSAQKKVATKSFTLHGSRQGIHISTDYRSHKPRSHLYNATLTVGVPENMGIM